MPVTQHTKWTWEAGPPAVHMQISTTSEDAPPLSEADQAAHQRLVQIAMAQNEPLPGYPILDWTEPPQ